MQRGKPRPVAALLSTLSRRNASFSTGSLPPSSVYLVVMTTLIIPRL